MFPFPPAPACGLSATNTPKAVKGVGRPNYEITCKKDVTVGYMKTKDIGSDLNDDKFQEQLNVIKR
jgi:hypothetical protein